MANRDARVPAEVRLPRRGVLTAGVLGAVAAATSACGGSGGSTALPWGEDLVFGACLDLTGSGALMGTAAQRGLQVALAKLNETGVPVARTNRRVRLVTRDGASDPGTAAAAAQQLINGDRVVGLIAGGTDATANAIAPIAEKAGIPMLSTAFADNIIKPVIQRRFVFKLGPDASDVAPILIAAAQSQRKPRIGVLATADGHGDSGITAVTTAISGATSGLALSLGRTARLPLGATDYHAPASSVASAYPRPDAIVIWAVAPAAGLAARALRAIGYQGVLFFDAGAASDDSLSAANRSAMDGGYLVSPFILSGSPLAVTTPAAVAQRDYFDQYIRLFGSFSGLSIYGADALNLLARAASRANSTDRLKIRNGLESAPFDGIAGGYTFSTISHGGVQRDSLRIFEVERSGWVQLS